ncbi:MAG: hypothetical protein HYV40_03055 [Candidatus Levybacteria bacterium]|nr:hypothetical protein [Candidatus Levybacteria bacterium]
MNFVTTNIRLPEDTYLELKAEAAKKRKTLSAIIREKLHVGKPKEKSPEEILQQIRKHAAENTKYLKGFDSLKALREIRDEPAW